MQIQNIHLSAKVKKLSVAVKNLLYSSLENAKVPGVGIFSDGRSEKMHRMTAEPKGRLKTVIMFSGLPGL